IHHTPAARHGDRELRSRTLILKLRHLFLALTLAALLLPPALAALAPESEDAAIAQSLAQMLRSARTVISESQAKIDDPALGDKGLSGKVVLDLAVQKYKTATGVDPLSIDAQSRG